MAKTIFTACGVAVALGVGLTVGAAVAVAGSAVGVSAGAGAVEVGGNVAVAAGCMGRLQPASMTGMRTSGISLAGFRKRVKGWLGFIWINLLVHRLSPNHSTSWIFIIILRAFHKYYLPQYSEGFHRCRRMDGLNNRISHVLPDESRFFQVHLRKNVSLNSFKML
jgi:hypothetical protein